jgi:uncharacterized protein YbbC (DUF1343 family)
MQTGLDRFTEDRALESLRAELGARRVALLSHPASVNRRLQHVQTVLAEGGVHPRLLFGPEHGYGGEAQYMDPIADAERGGVRIRSLYGDKPEDLAPVTADFDGIDVLVIDLQDVGSRYYTYVWTALLATRVALAAGAQVVIFDRPNPLGGVALEGALPVSKLYLSFVGLEPLPIRHGLTLGEIVMAFSPAHDGLRVIGVRDWNDALGAEAWDRDFVSTSPNMPTAETALVYPGGCLLEGTNLSEGRGTCRPFEIVGAPFLQGVALAAELEATQLPGFTARPVRFVPTFEKHAGRLCEGVHVHVTDRATFRPVATYAALLACAHRQAPDAFAFRTTLYEFRDDVPALDLLAGGPALRESIARQDAPRGIAELASGAVTATWQNERDQVVAFRRRGL